MSEIKNGKYGDDGDEDGSSFMRWHKEGYPYGKELSEEEFNKEVKNGKYVDNVGHIYWFKNDVFHRDCGPAVTRGGAYKAWYMNGLRHREDGPAIEGFNGYKEWWFNGLRHREDGPAVEQTNGSEEWWFEGMRHRLDGPAIIWANGEKVWFVFDLEMSEEQFHAYLEKDALKEALHLDLPKKEERSKVKI